MKSYGTDAAETVLDGEIASVQKSISNVGKQLKELEFKLEALMKAHDSNRPLEQFREKFKELLAIARVTEFSDISKWKLSKRPTDSGSPGPRSVVAYYGALWAAMQDSEGNLPSPLVIDSPNQNAQDRKNLERVMGLLAGKTPNNAQVILCAEEESEAFNADVVISLTDERALLKAELMDDVASEVLPRIEQAISALAGKSV